MNSNPAPNPPAASQASPEPQESCYNLLFSMNYGQKRWHHSRLNDKGRYAHETLIAENVPTGALHTFNHQMVIYSIRAASLEEGRAQWAVFYSLYEFDPDTAEAKWAFICSHYKRRASSPADNY